MPISEKYNHHQYILVPLLWFMLRYHQFCPSLLLYHDCKSKHSSSTRSKKNYEIQKHYSTLWIFQCHLCLNAKHSYKTRSSWLLSWCPYQLNTNKWASPAISVDSLICKSIVLKILSHLHACKQNSHLTRCCNIENWHWCVYFYWIFVSRLYTMSMVQSFIKLQLPCGLLQPVKYDNITCDIFQCLLKL